MIGCMQKHVTRVNADVTAAVIACTDVLAVLLEACICVTEHQRQHEGSTWPDCL